MHLDEAPREHVGLTALTAERSKLLQEYDAAVQQAADDPVKTEHGVSCEAHFRSFLQSFLPKKYGVTKGYIITPDLEYAGPLEEWDIVIYDAMESPVLFVRQNRDEATSAGKRGIPVEFVKGVVEVKATFNKAMAKKSTEKLLKLREFVRKDNAPRSKYGESHFPFGFRAFSVFFETKVGNAQAYKNALGALCPLWQAEPLLQFAGALIIRGETCPQFSASLSHAMAGMENFPDLLSSCCESSEPFPSFLEDMAVYVVSSGYGQNEFWQYMIDMVHALNGDDSDLPGMGPTNLTGDYGRISGPNKSVRLFTDA